MILVINRIYHKAATLTHARTRSRSRSHAHKHKHLDNVGPLSPNKFGHTARIKLMLSSFDWLIDDWLILSVCFLAFDRDFYSPNDFCLLWLWLCPNSSTCQSVDGLAILNFTAFGALFFNHTFTVCVCTAQSIFSDRFSESSHLV